MLRSLSPRSALLLTVAALIGGSLKASPYEVVITGNVDFIQGNESGAALGDPYTEAFYYDSSAPVAFQAATWVDYQNNVGAATFSVGHFSLTIGSPETETQDLFIYHGDPNFGTGYQMDATHYNQFADIAAIGARLWEGPTTLPITSAQPVQSLPLSDFGSTFGFVVFGSNGDQVDGDVTSYSVNAVADRGSSAWLLAVVLFPLAAARGRLGHSAA